MPLTTTTRTPPSGKRIRNGFKTFIAFSSKPGLNIWEKTVKPPGMDGGAPIDSSTMHNTKYRSKSPRSLITSDDVTGTAGYDPSVITDMNSLINVEQSITIKFPNGGTLDFFGFLQKFDFTDLTEEGFPMANYTIVVTNVDPATDVETDPVYTPPVGGAPMNPPSPDEMAWPPGAGAEEHEDGGELVGAGVGTGSFGGAKAEWSTVA